MLETHSPTQSKMDKISYSQEDIEAMMIAAERWLKEDVLRTLRLYRDVAKNGRTSPTRMTAAYGHTVTGDLNCQPVMGAKTV